MHLQPLVAALAAITTLSLLHVTSAAEPVRSGLQPGETITAIFEPLNVTGPFANEQHCLVCENGPNPVVMIFARDVSPALVQLLAKVDAATEKHRAQQLGSFVVFLNDRADLPASLRQVAKEKSLSHTVLSIDAPGGPDGFKVSHEADITVVLYEDFNVKANHAFRAGELNETAVERIIADLPKIITKK